MLRRHSLVNKIEPIPFTSIAPPSNTNFLIFFLYFFHCSWSFSIDLDNSTSHLKTIILGAGCFWSVEKKFQETYGVIDVQSGYADGKNIKPSYKEIIKRENRFNPNNYAEVVKVTYNSNKTSLENLLKTFFEMHDPTAGTSFIGVKSTRLNPEVAEYRKLKLAVEKLKSASIDKCTSAEVMRTP